MYQPSVGLTLSDPSLPMWHPRYILLLFPLTVENLPFLDSAFLNFPLTTLLSSPHQSRQLPLLPSSRGSVITESLSAGAQQGCGVGPTSWCEAPACFFPPCYFSIGLGVHRGCIHSVQRPCHKSRSFYTDSCFMKGLINTFKSW